MRPASQRPTSGLLVEERPLCVDPPATAPAFIVDTDAGTLVGANPAGWAAWGLDPATAAAPLALDRAMPALQHLREIAATQTSGLRRETLTFWTPRGLLRLACRVEPSKLPGGNALGFSVQALEAVPAAGTRGPPA